MEKYIYFGCKLTRVKSQGRSSFLSPVCVIACVFNVFVSSLDFDPNKSSRMRILIPHYFTLSFQLFYFAHHLTLQT